MLRANYYNSITVYQNVLLTTTLFLHSICVTALQRTTTDLGLLFTQLWHRTSVATCLRSVVLSYYAWGFFLLQTWLSMVVVAGVKILDLQKTNTIFLLHLLRLTLFKQKTNFPSSSFFPQMHFILFQLGNFLTGHKFLASHLELHLVVLIRLRITTILHTQKLWIFQMLYFFLQLIKSRLLPYRNIFMMRNSRQLFSLVVESSPLPKHESISRSVTLFLHNGPAIMSDIVFPSLMFHRIIFIIKTISHSLSKQVDQVFPLNIKMFFLS